MKYSSSKLYKESLNINIQYFDAGLNVIAHLKLLRMVPQSLQKRLPPSTLEPELFGSVDNDSNVVPLQTSQWILFKDVLLAEWSDPMECASDEVLPLTHGRAPLVRAPLVGVNAVNEL